MKNCIIYLTLGQADFTVSRTSGDRRIKPKNDFAAHKKKCDECPLVTDNYMIQ